MSREGDLLEVQGYCKHRFKEIFKELDELIAAYPESPDSPLYRVTVLLRNAVMQLRNIVESELEYQQVILEKPIDRPGSAP